MSDQTPDPEVPEAELEPEADDGFADTEADDAVDAADEPEPA